MDRGVKGGEARGWIITGRVRNPGLHYVFMIFPEIRRANRKKGLYSHGNSVCSCKSIISYVVL